MENPSAQEKFNYDPNKFLDFKQFVALFDDYVHNIGIYEVRGNSYIIRYANKSMFKTIQLSPEETLNKRLRKVVPGADAMGVTKVLERVHKTGISEYFPASVYQDDRIAGWFDTYVVKLPSGNLMAIYENKTMEKQLEQEIRFVVETANDGYFNWDLTSGKVEYSEKYTQLLGYTKEEFGTTPEAWEERLHPADKERMLKTVTEFIENAEKGIETQFRMLGKNGEYYNILSKVAKITNPDGKPKALHGFHIDITAREKLRRELEGKIKELETLNDAMVGREMKMVELKNKLKKAGIDEW